ncbi:hypothetical protein EON64_03360 [archaeon]|nr:MAG: hypothetical protein EON64_03360 [archaeon]
MMSFLPSLSPSARAQTTPFSDRKKSVFATLPIPAVEEIDRNKSLREDNWRSKLFALDDDYIDTSLDLDPNKSKWHAQASIVKNRPRGWLQRFAVNLDESNIRIPPPTPTEQRERRLQEVGWTNIKVQRSSIALCVDDDEEETPEQNTALIAYPQLAPKLKSCCYCCLGVPTGAEYVGCRSCNVVSHINCLPDIDNYIKPEHLGKIQNPVGVLRTQRSAVAGSKRLQFAMPKDHSQSSRTLLASSRPRSSPLTASGNISLVTSNNLTASCLMWTCQFCSFERQAYVDTKAEMQEQQRQRCKLLRCAVTIQAFCRMVTERIRYQKFLRGLRMLQNIIRMRRLVEKSEVDRANKR